MDRRKRMRYLIIQASIRWKNDQIGTYFDFWKATMIRDAASTHIGRIGRGFCGRRRAVFLHGLQKRSVKVQSAARQLFHRLQYKQLLAKRTWAATTIQRHDRGYMCRRRVKTTIEALYDIGLRNIAIERTRWIAARQLKAVVLVQSAVRRWRFKRAVASRVKIKVIVERSKKHVKTVLRKADKQKIPMEIPEAKEIAVDEIIDQIVEEELELVRQEGRKEAEDYTVMQEKKLVDAKAKLEKERKRKRTWGAIKIQGMFRCFAAKRTLRLKAYKRFEKRFDPTTFNYYYTDVRSRKSSWTKPLALGKVYCDC